MTIRINGGHLNYRHGRRGTVELVDIQVHQEKRRRGIGTALLQELEHEIGGGMMIYCFSRVENEAAHRFYEKNGFEEKASIESFYTVNYGHSGGAVILVKKT